MMQTHKIKQCFNRAAMTYDDDSFPQQFIGKKLMNIVNCYAGNIDCAIDMGCGTGLITKKLVNTIQPKYFFAIDIANELLNKAKHHLQHHVIYFFEEDFEQFILKNHYYDLVFANMSLQWSEHFFPHLVNVSQRLNPGGILAFSLPVDGHFCELPECGRNAYPSFMAITDFLHTLHLTTLSCFEENYIFHFNTWQKCIKSIKAVGANFLQCKNKKSLSKEYLYKIHSLTYKIAYFVVKKPNDH